MKRLLLTGAVLGYASFLLAQSSPPTLPNTSLLTANPDFSATMVAGIDKFLLRQTELDKAKRAAFWHRDLSSPEAYTKSLAPNREHLRQIIGAVDPRVPIATLELVGDLSHPAVLAENDHGTIQHVRWPVFDGVHGEGLLIQPKGKVLARVVYVPDADSTPELVAGFKDGSFDSSLLDSGVQIVIPTLLSRGSDFSGNERLGAHTNCTHREWIYRQSFILGRHIIGYEVQKVLALVDWFAAQPDKVPTAVAGLGEGGMLAMYAGALDTRIDSVYVWGYFSPREELWKEPLYRNVFGLLREFGDAEIASMIAPRHLAIQNAGFPEVSGPPTATKGQRAVAAPGALTTPSAESVQAEAARAKALTGSLGGDWLKVFEHKSKAQEIVAHLFPTGTAMAILQSMAGRTKDRVKTEFQPVSPQQSQVHELETFTQRLLFSTETQRNSEFWKPLPLKSLPEYEKHTAAERDRFWNDVIGKFPDPNLPMNARSRFVSETDKIRIYEVTLDVWDGVFAWGWLCLPKDQKSGEKRPVVVCQHGLEGIPEDTVTTDEKNKSWAYYHGFATRLAEQGFVTFAPHNPYRGHDAFRTLQRKLNPLGKSLYSVINGQHQRILEWLKQQPFTDPHRIAFYGLSYGGKSAMRTPAVLTDYCLSICSGDFNEWVRKCASTDLPMSYVFTPEYEIWEWNLGQTFNYAEMGALIAPRPFMVERGHNDGVGIDEWVNYEYAKIRRLYNKLGIGERTTIEHFDGPHTIHGVGSYEFLKEKLRLGQP